MKKTQQQLEAIENLIKRTYNGYGNKLREILNKPFSPESPELGYSWRYDSDDGTIVYNVVVSNLGEGEDYTSFQIKLHEYGHIYLGHFDGIYEELDKKVYDTLTNYRGQIIESINENCGIDFGEKLVERVLDDPELNHSLHNIAMDFEVNSKILGDENIEDMEAGVCRVLERILNERAEKLMSIAKSDEEKKKIQEKIEKVRQKMEIKFILPKRYHTPDGAGFPEALTYPEYLLLIIRNLDQFVKMLISLSQGGNGDTSEISKEQCQDALKNGSLSIDELMKKAGMSTGGQGKQSGQGNDQGGGDGNSKQSQTDSNGLGTHNTENSGGLKYDNETIESQYSGIRSSDPYDLGEFKDHCSPSRYKADVDREAGEITGGGGFGCGNGGSPETFRQVKKTDVVDEAIEEVIRRTKSRVIKRTIKRDVIRNWNLGKNRTVIAPSIIAKNRIDTKPKLVYIIDVSGSMDTELVDRVINSISKKMKSINRGLVYDILTWSHNMGDWITDIQPGKLIPHLHCGGGTDMADALRFFHDKYDSSATFILISDFEDYLDEWIKALKDMPEYEGWGFNYGTRNYNMDWPKNFTVRNFNKSYVRR